MIIDDWVSTFVFSRVGAVSQALYFYFPFLATVLLEFSAVKQGWIVKSQGWLTTCSCPARMPASIAELELF